MSAPSLSMLSFQRVSGAASRPACLTPLSRHL